MVHVDLYGSTQVRSRQNCQQSQDKAQYHFDPSKEGLRAGLTGDKVFL